MADTDFAKRLALRKTVAVVGMMGAGKTAVGRAVAQLLNVPFLDSDHEIEMAANMAVADIFSRYGEPFFRDKETRVIARLLEDKCGILSTGGGAFMSANNRQLISDQGISVWLDADLDLLWSRVRTKDTRPLLRGADPYGTLKQLYETRVPVYALADLRVKSLAGLSIDQMARRVLAVLESRPDVLEKLE